jgi:hypothetical protein
MFVQRRIARSESFVVPSISRQMLQSMGNRLLLLMLLLPVEFGAPDSRERWI